MGLYRSNSPASASPPSQPRLPPTGLVVENDSVEPGWWYLHTLQPRGQNNGGRYRPLQYRASTHAEKVNW
jgi:hypothetical protein